MNNYPVVAKLSVIVDEIEFKRNRRESLMYKKIIFCFTILLVFPVSVMAGGKSPWEMKLPFKYATINYIISGVENGTEVTYIRDSGKEVASYHTTKTSLMGMSIVNETVDITTPDWQYNFDITNHSGRKSVNPEKYMIVEYNKLSKAEKKQVHQNVEKMGPSVAKGLGGKIQQNAEKILGYYCDRADMMGTVAYSIHGTDIPLRVESNMMGMSMKIEAISVKEGKVADKFFQLPAGIEPYLDPQSDAIARNVAKETIAMLKDPEGAEKLQAEALQERLDAEEQMTPEQKQQVEQAMQMMQGLFGGQKQQ